ncbi:MAG: superoxide dismutase [Elusimicrobia bacterium]|nr:superoxide dismutase [Elusimicrobiota bacterium]
MNPEYRVRHELRPARLDGISESEIAHHWALYEGYVKHLNGLTARASALLENDDLGKEFLELKRRLAYAYNPVILHERYFSVLKPGQKPLGPEARFTKLLKKSFGGFDAWRKEFSTLGRMRGAGWVILYLDPARQALSNHGIGMQEEGHPAGFLPVLAMDVWEHAYTLDRGGGGIDGYVERFLDNVDWGRVERSVRAAERLEPDVPEGVAFAAE